MANQMHAAEFPREADRVARTADRSGEGRILTAATPPVTRSDRFDMATFVGRTKAHLDLWIVDHGFCRIFWLNRRRVSPKMERSGYLLPYHIRSLPRRGVRTLVNLRGYNDSGWYHVEVDACHRAGLEFVDFGVRSRAAPRKADIFGAEQLFDTIRYPAVMHCKSGADRAGLMSVLYLMLHERRPVEEAMRHLHWQYGHVRHAKTGIIDYFFERYRRDNARAPIDFLDWVDRVYDPEELTRCFGSSGWANLLIDGVLRRE